MNEDELREILAKTPLPDETATQGAELRVYTLPEWDFVVKVPRQVAIRDLQLTLEGYERGRAHMGGYSPKISSVDRPVMKILESNGEISDSQPKIALVQGKELMLPRYYKNHKAYGIDPAKVGRGIAIVDRTMQQSGCYKHEASVDDYGITPDGRVDQIDLGTVLRGNPQGDNPLQRFEPVDRGHQLYERLWTLQKHAPRSLWEAYLDEAKLSYEELDTTIDEAELRTEIEIIEERLAEVILTDGKNRLFAAAVMSSDESKKQLATEYILCRRFEKEFYLLAAEERIKYYESEGVGVPIEPFLTS